MLRLNELMKALVNDIETARIDADLSSLAAAEMYAKNDKIRQLDLSIPRMKIQEVDIGLDVFISAFNLPKDQTIPPPEIVVQKEELIQTSLNFLRPKLVDTKEAEDLYTSISNLFIQYEKRYIPDDLSEEAVVERLSTYFSKKLKSISTEVLKNPDEDLGKDYQLIFKSSPSLKSVSSMENDVMLEINFSQPEAKTNFSKATIKVKLIENDLVWGLHERSES